MNQHFCVFKGVNSLDIGLHIERVPEPPIPAQRFDSITVPGRHGTLTTTDGTYEPFTYQLEFVLWDAARVEQARTLFHGAGWLTLSNNPTRRRQARINNSIDISQVIGKLRRFPVEFLCQPFAYEVYPDVLEAPRTLYNCGNYEALPEFKLFGTGNAELRVNEKSFIIHGMTGHAVVDCENLQVKGDNLLVTEGDFHNLALGTGRNELSWSSNIQKILVQPNWRWL